MIKFLQGIQVELFDSQLNLQSWNRDRKICEEGEVWELYAQDDDLDCPEDSIEQST